MSSKTYVGILMLYNKKISKWEYVQGSKAKCNIEIKKLPNEGEYKFIAIKVEDPTAVMLAFPITHIRNTNRLDDRFIHLNLKGITYGVRFSDASADDFLSSYELLSKTMAEDGSKDETCSSLPTMPPSRSQGSSSPKLEPPLPPNPNRMPSPEQGRYQHSTTTSTIPSPPPPPPVHPASPKNEKPKTVVYEINGASSSSNDPGKSSQAGPPPPPPPPPCPPPSSDNKANNITNSGYNSGGGLNASIASVKLKKSQPSPVPLEPKPAAPASSQTGEDFMSEMAKKLNKRKQAINDAETGGSNSTASQPVEIPALPVFKNNTSASSSNSIQKPNEKVGFVPRPSVKDKPTVVTATNRTSDAVHAADLNKIKEELIQMIQSEFKNMKLEILDAISKSKAQ